MEQMADMMCACSQPCYRFPVNWNFDGHSIWISQLSIHRILSVSEKCGINAGSLLLSFID